MSASAQAVSATADHVAIGTRPTSLTPQIADIIRTQYCVPGSVFLVESVDADIPTGKRHRAVRLLLGDGQLCIQALLLPELHGFVGSGRVHAGCYVRLKNFGLRSIRIFQEQCEGGDGREKRQSTMVYLLLQDLAVVGCDAAYKEMLAMQSLTAERPPDVVDDLAKGKSPNAGLGVHTAHADTSTAQVDSSEMSPRSTPLRTDEDVHEMKGPRKQHTERRVRFADLAAYEPHPPGQYGHLPWATDDPRRPVKLTALHAIAHLPYKQNWMVNVLAVLASLSDTEPSHLPPYSQRTARLADPSTAKQVHLTVFLEPEAFTPAVGSVVLLLGVKNHRFDGGSLKKYMSDRLKNGMSWWLENPEGLSWCDVAGLREWWDARQEGNAQ